MLLYDWKKIFDTVEGDSYKAFAVIRMLAQKQYPKNKYDPIYRFVDQDFTGSSFLAHEDVLIYNAYKHSYHDIGIYIALASLRSHAEYIVNGTTTLELLASPVGDPLNYLKDTKNRLLSIEDDLIHFLYEEVPQEKEKWH